MMMALAGMRDLPCVLVPGGVTLPPTRRRGRRQGADDRRPLRPRRDHARGGGRAGLPRLRHRRAAAASSSAPRPRRRSSARRSGCRCRTRRWRRPASRSGSTWRAARPGRSCALRSARPDDARHPHRRRRPQRDGRPRGLRRLDEPAAAHPGRSPTHAGLPRPTVDDWTDVNRQVPRLVDALPNGPVGHPTVRVFLAGGVPEVMLHLRDLGLLDARRADRRPASRSGEVLDWWEKSRAPRTAARAAAASATASIPTTSSCRPDAARERGLTSTVTLPARQPRPGRLGHQEHGDRSRASSTPTASTARSARRASSPRERDADRRDQEPRPGARQAGRRARADLPRAAGRRHGGDLPDHLGAQAPAAAASTSRCSPTPASPASRPAPASATSAPKRWPAARSASCATATASRSSSTATGSKAASTSSATASATFGAEEGARVLAARPPRPDLAPDPRPAGRHAPLGGAAAGQRRHLGRLRLRRRRHRGRARRAAAVTRRRRAGGTRRARRGGAASSCRLGVTAFGGPAAHIAMMRDEVVRRRGWLDDAALPRPARRRRT